MEKNSIITGLVLGATVPVLGFMLIEQLFDIMAQYGLVANASGAGLNRRMRTILLLAICTILIPFNWAKRNYHTETMRGMIFPTIIYVGYWVYKFAHILL